MTVLNSSQITIINQVKKLAEERDNANAYHLREFKEKNLNDYLSMLNIEMLRVIQSVMYIGLEESKNSNSDSTLVFKRNFDSLTELNDNSSEMILSILNKQNLSKALENGLDVLSLRI